MKIHNKIPAAIYLVHLLLAGIVHLVFWLAAVLKIREKISQREPLSKLLGI